ncbi:MAG: iron transporter [Streptosporangiaceae bacterium]|nr:iron transporter [Streptosporangiaceae bacterium]
MFLGNFLIGLREGLEAALVVSILIAYLVKKGNRGALTPVWMGIGAAVAVSVGFALLLQLVVAQENHFRIQELTGGLLSIIAVGLVTWMVFWMRRAARGMKAELEGRLDSAIGMGAGALFVVAFLSVGREGLETALFLWTNISHSTGSPVQPVGGAVTGLAVAVVLGYLIYRGGLKLNLKAFFTWTGAGLIIVAAGVLGYGFHDLQEADVLPGITSLALEPANFFAHFGAVGDWLQTIFQGVLNVTPKITWLQLIVWAAYVATVMFFFLRPTTPAAVSPAKTPQTASS